MNRLPVSDFNFLSIEIDPFYISPWCICTISTIIMFGSYWSLSILYVTTFRNYLWISLYFYSIASSSIIYIIFSVSFSFFSAPLLFISAIIPSMILIMVLSLKLSLKPEFNISYYFLHMLNSPRKFSALISSQYLSVMGWNSCASHKFQGTFSLCQ